MENIKCRICNNVNNNSNYIAEEMMFGLHEKFVYVKCSYCGCLQISDEPLDMGPFYAVEKYYSLKLSQIDNSIKSKLAAIIREKIIAYRLGKFNIIGILVYIFFHRYEKRYKWLNLLNELKRASNILDVGCGLGSLLLDFNKLGFKNLTGIDPFIKNDISYSCGVRILKKNIFDLDNQYDFIMLNHSFEHMDHPHSTFEQLNKLLKSDGRLLIRIPVVDSFCWRKYGVWWYQLDAPRHHYLYTVRSMAILAKNHNFEIVKIEYDSNEDQFINSEKYLRNISLFEKAFFSSIQIFNWKNKAKRLNRIYDGDQACFILKKTNISVQQI